VAEQMGWIVGDEQDEEGFRVGLQPRDSIRAHSKEIRRHEHANDDTGLGGQDPGGYHEYRMGVAPA
jgi:hypothetical protein